MPGELVSINGEIFKPSKAKVSVFDRGFLYGDSVYEVARRYDGVFFGLEDHIDRMFYSASRIGLDLKKTKRDYISEIYRVAEVSGLDNAYMRIVVTRGEGGINLDPNSSDNINCVIFMRGAEKFIVPENYKNGLDIITAVTERNTKKATDPNVKSGNYLNSVLALGEAKKSKSHDAIMVDRDGFVTEGTTWNFYIVKKGVVITPPEDSDILLGITRKKLKEICKKNKIPFKEKKFKPSEAQKADEAFASGSFKEVTPIRSLDGKVFPSGVPGPMTEKLMKLYKNSVKEYCRKWQNK